VSTYHLHARLLKGPLAAPERDELRVWETDSWDDAQGWAREQLAHGLTVWIYDHGHVTPIAGASDYRVVAHMRPTRIASTRTASPTRRRPDPPDLEPAGLLIPGGSSAAPPPDTRWIRRYYPPERQATPTADCFGRVRRSTTAGPDRLAPVPPWLTTLSTLSGPQVSEPATLSPARRSTVGDGLVDGSHASSRPCSQSSTSQPHHLRGQDDERRSA
jgi:hypothetical protein